MKIWPSYFMRLALSVALLPVLIMGAGLTWTYRSTAAQLKLERTYQINDEIAALVEIYTNQNAAGLVRSIENRMKLTPKTRAHTRYALIGFNGGLLAGNLSAAAADKRHYTQFVDWQSEEAQPFLLRSTPLRGGEILQVARSDAARQNLLVRMRKLYALLAFATLGLGVLAGLFAASMFKRRIKAVNETCGQIAQGHLGARVPGADSGDELGVLTGNVNAMLDRIGTLIALRKNITDQVAHELRSPLTRLDAKLVRLAKKGEDAQAIKDARTEITNCISLLDALLDVSSLEAQSGDKTGFARVDLSHLAAQMCEFYEGLAEDKSIALNCDIQPHVSMQGDEMQLSRLIANLLDNALKYTPSGGKVTINVQEDLILSVQDTGIGVPETLRTSIFVPFFRDPALMAARGSTVEGHGLGLALSQAIAKRHGMVLRAEDSQSGARFVLKPLDP